MRRGEDVASSCSGNSISGVSIIGGELTNSVASAITVLTNSLFVFFGDVIALGLLLLYSDGFILDIADFELMGSLEDEILDYFLPGVSS